MSAPELRIWRVRGERDADIPLPRSRRRAAPEWTCARLSRPTSCSAPGERALIPTGFALAIPSGYEGQVRPRSGLALHAGVTLANAPGTIDADYRGELGVILVNLGARAVPAAAR